MGVGGLGLLEVYWWLGKFTGRSEEWEQVVEVRVRRRGGTGCIVVMDSTNHGLKTIFCGGEVEPGEAGLFTEQRAYNNNDTFNEVGHKVRGVGGDRRSGGKRSNQEERVRGC